MGDQAAQPGGCLVTIQPLSSHRAPTPLRSQALLPTVQTEHTNALVPLLHSSPPIPVTPTLPSIINPAPQRPQRPSSFLPATPSRTAFCKPFSMYSASSTTKMYLTITITVTVIRHPARCYVWGTARAGTPPLAGLFISVLVNVHMQKWSKLQ